MVQIKDGVDLHGISEKMWAAVPIIKECYQEVHFGYAVVITSGRDGRHMTKSKHYEGNALDFRIHHLTEIECTQIRKEIIRKISKDYNVVYHVGSHIHVEYDPRGV